MNHLATDIYPGGRIANVGIADRGTWHLVDFAQANLQLVAAVGEPAVKVAQIRTAAAYSYVVERWLAAHGTRQDQPQAGVARIRREGIFALQERRLLQHVGQDQRLSKNQLRLIGFGERIIGACQNSTIRSDQLDHGVQRMLGAVNVDPDLGPRIRSKTVYVAVVGGPECTVHFEAQPQVLVTVLFVLGQLAQRL